MLYTCCALWDVIKDYTKDKKRWRVYLLKEFEPKFMLWVDTCVLYQVSQRIIFLINQACKRKL